MKQSQAGAGVWTCPWKTKPEECARDVAHSEWDSGLSSIEGAMYHLSVPPAMHCCLHVFIQQVFLVLILYL